MDSVETARQVVERYWTQKELTTGQKAGSAVGGGWVVG